MKVLGQDLTVVAHQVEALAANLISWARSSLTLRAAAAPALDSSTASHAVQVTAPGGWDRVVSVPLTDDDDDDPWATIGYNVWTRNGDQIEALKPPFVRQPADFSTLPKDLVLVEIEHYSVNYADITIRWGLYESAIQFVGYPIVPGFDISGRVVWAGGDVTNVAVGDAVCGVTFFGGYSTRCLVPAGQLHRVPSGLTGAQAAAWPATAATALHAFYLAGFWPSAPVTRNRAVLVHSAAGGVGSMMLQVARVLGCTTVAAVVGSERKVPAARRAGATHVFVRPRGAARRERDKWIAGARSAAPGGYAAVMDATGVATLADSYALLAQTGRLITYGYHSNLPTGVAWLSPAQWLGMALRLWRMPKVEYMDLCLSSKGVIGFNLSFFRNETALITRYMEQLVSWIEGGQLRVIEVDVRDWRETARAHEAMSSGDTVGKLVLHNT